MPLETRSLAHFLAAVSWENRSNCVDNGGRHYLEESLFPEGKGPLVFWQLFMNNAPQRYINLRGITLVLFLVAGPQRPVKCQHQAHTKHKCLPLRSSTLQTWMMQMAQFEATSMFWYCFFQQEHKCLSGNIYKAFISWTWAKKIALVFCSNSEFSFLVKVEIKATSWRSVAKAIIYTRCLWTISTFYHHPNLHYQMPKFI